MKVRSSTRATSFGAERARKQPGQSFSLSLVKVPAWTSWSQRKSYSACEPSIQWMLSGWVRSAIFSTQRMRCLLVVGGAAMAASTIAVFIGLSQILRIQVFASEEGLSTCITFFAAAAILVEIFLSIVTAGCELLQDGRTSFPRALAIAWLDKL